MEKNGSGGGSRVILGENRWEGEPVSDGLESPEEGEDKSRDGAKRESSRRMRASLGLNGGEVAEQAEETEGSRSIDP